MKHRVLGIPNENKLAGKGISWCAICDGSLYRGKDVAVVGGGNSALEESLYLSKIVNKVYLIHRRDQFRAEPLLVDKIKATKNIELVLNDEITGLNGQDFLESIDLKNNPQIKVDGLFEYIGFLPSSELVTKFNITDEAGFIIADENCETPIPKMFAIGDVRQKKVRQIVTAISDGAIAALQVNKCFG
jgi:thioredoxin reductase (NADPH)